MLSFVILSVLIKSNQRPLCYHLPGAKPPEPCRQCRNLRKKLIYQHFALYKRAPKLYNNVGVFNPSPRRYAPQFSPIFSCTTPRNASGHGRGRRLNTNDFLSPPKIVSDARDALRLFILLSSEKNEPRSAAAVIGLLARRYGRRRGLRNSLRSDSPRPFSSVFLATSPPDKGGDFASLFNPLALRALPLYSLTETQGERVRVPFCSLQCDTPHTGYGRGRVGVMLNFRLALFPI